MGAITRFNLNDYIKKYQTSVFIETGTAYGDGVSVAATYPFKKIYSVEYNFKMCIDCQNKFMNDERISIICNNSTDGLTQIFEENVELENIVFWLDAHYPYEDYNKGDESIRLPLHQELLIIKKYRSHKNDVILIDDIRIYEDDNYESGNLPSHIRKGEDQNLSFVYELFSNTHFIDKDLSSQGYLILTPKNTNI